MRLISVILFSSFAALSSYAQSAATEVVSFRQALSQMVNDNVNVKVQESNVRASEQKILAARGLFLPQVSANYSQTLGGGNPPQQSYAWNAGLNLFHWGADLAQIDAAHLDQSAQSSALDGARLDAEATAAEALFNLIEQSQALEAYKRSESNARNFHDIAEQRYKKSYLSAQELDKVTLDLSNAEAARADTEAKLTSARATVTALLGHALIVTNWPWEKEILSTDATRLQASDSHEALMKRPDYRAAKSHYESEVANEKSLARAILPKLDFTYSLIDSYASGSNFAVEGHGWTTVASFTIPFFNGLQDLAKHRIEEQNKVAIETQLRQLERDISSQQADAIARYKIAIEQYKNRLKDLSLAERLLTADTSRFKMGRADANDINQDLERVKASQLNSIKSVHDAHSAYMRLLHANGLSVQ